MTTMQPDGAVLTLATGAVTAQVFSTDGKTLYTARGGTISAYDVTSGSLLSSWSIGTQLGGIDVSPDGKHLIAIENSPTPDSTGGFPAYQVDLSTGHVTTFELPSTDNYPNGYGDVAYLSDGTVVVAGAGQWETLTTLNTNTGETGTTGGSYEAPTLTVTPDHKHILISPLDTSDAPLYLYEQGKGVTASHESYQDGIEGYNAGAQAVSPDGSLSIEAVSLAVYDSNLHLVTKLTDRYPFEAAGFAFSPDSSKLYLLDPNANEVFVLSTSTWDILGGYAVGQSVAGNDGYSYSGSAPATHYGDALLVSADGSHLAISTSVSVQVIDLGLALSDTGTSAGNDVLTGDSANNILYGFEGNDTLDGKSGSDTLYGGAGNDTYYVDNPGDSVVEAAGGGNDVVYTSYSGFTIPSQVETMILTGDATIGYGNEQANAITANNEGDSLYGMDGDDVLTGGTGQDLLDGGTGNDRLVGGAGDDNYIVESPGDVVVEAAGGGTDTVTAYVSYTLPDNVENLTIAPGTQTLSATGNALNNTILGNDGDNRIDGGAGNDTMYGGAGDDTYIVDSARDLVYENANAGYDTVLSAVSYTLGKNTEALTLTGHGATSATGNALANVLTGNDAANVLDGGAGDDTMYGGAGDDTYVVDSARDLIFENTNAGYDTVLSAVSYTLGKNIEALTLTGHGATSATGNDAANILTGNDAANVLDGGAGNDTMYGGAGDDTYIVDSARDLVYENANAGYDTVLSAVSYTLGKNTEALTLTGHGATSATGNGLANVLTGNDAANVLDGGAGNDTMYGGAGNDTYVVDNARDLVYEGANNGYDTILSAVSYTLGKNTEALTLTGHDATSATGNDLANALTGNDAANTLIGNGGNDVLDGGLGHDSLQGGTGDDTYIVDSAHDQVIEAANAGTDTVRSAVSWTLGANLENLVLTGSSATAGTGNALANTLTGNDRGDTLSGLAGDDHLIGGTGADTLSGGDGNDVLVGGAGRDVLTGGAGSDHFVFGAASDFASAKGAGADEITDFATGDRIDLSAIDAVPGGHDDAFSWIGTAAFDGHGGELRMYEQAGATYLQADLNGDRVTDFALKLDGLHALTAADFVL